MQEDEKILKKISTLVYLGVFFLIIFLVILYISLFFDILNVPL